MNRDRLEGQWQVIKGRIKEQWGRLTDDRLDELEGQWDQIAGLIQKEYGIALDDAKQSLNKIRMLTEDELADARRTR